MPTIEVYGLDDSAHRCLLRAELIAATRSIEELELAPNQITVRLVQEMDPDGRDIAVVVNDLFENPTGKPLRTAEIRQRLAQSLGEVVRRLCPRSSVEVKVHKLRLNDDGYWKS